MYLCITRHNIYRHKISNPLVLVSRRINFDSKARKGYRITDQIYVRIARRALDDEFREARGKSNEMERAHALSQVHRQLRPVNSLEGISRFIKDRRLECLTLDFQAHL